MTGDVETDFEKLVVWGVRCALIALAYFGKGFFDDYRAFTKAQTTMLAQSIEQRALQTNILSGINSQISEHNRRMEEMERQLTRIEEEINRHDPRLKLKTYHGE